MTPTAQIEAASFPLPANMPSKASRIGLIQRIFSFPCMLGAFLVAIVFAATRVFRLDPDVWWHLKVGQLILSFHHFPTTDPYSFTVHGQPWFAYEWLGEVISALAYRVGGLQGLAAFSFFLGCAVVLSLYVLATSRSGNAKAGFTATAVMAIFAVMSFSLRPQVLGYLFLVLTVIALNRFREGQQGMVWFLPALMLLWVNTHGSWIIGMGTIFVYWIAGYFGFRAGNLEAQPWSVNERCQLGCVFLLSTIALAITPYGTRLAASPFEFAFSLPLNIENIEEWQAMPFHDPVGKAFLMLLLFVIAALVTLDIRWRLEEMFLFLVGTAMACIHIRFVLVFVPFATPLLARIFARWIPAYEARKDKPVLNAAFILLVLVVIVRFFPTTSELSRRIADTFPVDAVHYLAENHVPEPMFNNYNFGGYLVWTRGPEHKVFIDGRGDVYERGGVFGDYSHIKDLMPGALKVLDGYGIQSCLIKRDEPLAALLTASPAWRRIYVDSLSALFIRTSQ